LVLLEKKLITNLAGNNAIIEKIMGYIIHAGGKRLRPAVSFLFAKALNNGCLSSSHFSLGQALEMIHTATLMHDDVIDEAETRRGLLTVGKKWGDKTAIISGDYLLARSLMQLAGLKNNSVVKIFATAMNDVCEGEIQQNSQNGLISFDEYIEKSKRKTAALFAAGTQSAAVLTPNVNNLTVKAAGEYALNFGIAFQIVDDVLNFTSDKDETGKPAVVDFKNGIITAPVLFAIQEYEERGDLTLKNLVIKQSENEDEFNNCLNLILNSSGIQKAKELAFYYADLAKKSLDVIEDSIYKEALSDLTAYIIERRC